jgi:predicted DNA-binding transcriptional regulator AlpA
MDTPKYIDEKEVSRITSRSVQTLRNDRHKGVGFPYVKLGRAVRYNLCDVIEYMERRKVNPINASAN